MIIGVGLLLFSMVDGGSMMYVIRELKSKPEICKEKGMLSFPLETFKESDKSFEGALDRLIVEEIGVPRNEVRIAKVVPVKFHLIPGRSDIATVYGYGLLLDHRQEFFPLDNDIEFAGWYTCEELLSAPLKRVEVAPILGHYNKRHASYIPPERGRIPLCFR